MENVHFYFPLFDHFYIDIYISHMLQNIFLHQLLKRDNRYDYSVSASVGVSTDSLKSGKNTLEFWKYTSLAVFRRVHLLIPQ